MANIRFVCPDDDPIVSAEFVVSSPIQPRPKSPTEGGDEDDADRPNAPGAEVGSGSETRGKGGLSPHG